VRLGRIEVHAVAAADREPRVAGCATVVD
jgi:hypothetical protein